MKISNFPSVTILIAVKDATTTVIHTLKSLFIQTYPIKEIIVIDNVSKDDSVALVENYRNNHKKIPIRIIRHKNNIGVEGSYNEGARMAKTEFIVFMHSDSSLPSKYELSRLIEPLRNDPSVIYSAPILQLPVKIWMKFNFWQKCLLVRAVGVEVHGLNGKFDCTRRKEYLAIGGPSEEIFGQNIGTGGGDAEMAVKLLKFGKIASSSARVTHLHHLSQGYSLWDWIENRKLLARTHGRVLRVLGIRAAGPVFVVVKLLLVLLSLIPHLFPYNFALIFVYAIMAMGKMYKTKSTLADCRILILPFITIFLLYYEVFWMLNGILFLPKPKAISII